MNTIRRYRSAAEAAIARTLLTEAGIEATLADEGVATLGPQFAPWGIRLQVPEEDTERAVEILGEVVRPGEIPMDVTPEPGGPREYEVGAAKVANSDEPSVVCPSCGSGWALDDEELAQPAFTCTDCGTVIALRPEEIADGGANTWWRGFLPRSESKWVFAIVIVAYSLAVTGVWDRLIMPFLPPYSWSYYAYGWSNTLLRIGFSVVFWPITETLLFAGIIEMLRKFRAPKPIQVFFAVLALSSVDGLKHFQHGVAVAPSFALMGFTYVYWRRISWKEAFVTVAAVHAIYNTALETQLVMNQIRQDIGSARLTGNPFAIDDASSDYRQAVRDSETGKTDQEIALLEKAIAIYPHNIYYYIYLGIAQRDKKEYPVAEQTLRKALELSGVSWLAWDDLSYVLYDEARYGDAMKAANRALDLVPDDRRSEVETWVKYMMPKYEQTSH
jgi:tetratricopeptide (TPR) repeat protein